MEGGQQTTARTGGMWKVSGERRALTDKMRISLRRKMFWKSRHTAGLRTTLAERVSLAISFSTPISIIFVFINRIIPAISPNFGPAFKNPRYPSKTREAWPLLSPSQPFTTA